MPITYVRKSTDDPILLVADRLAGRIRAAFLNAVAVAVDSVSLAKIQDALERGNSAEVLAIITDSMAGALEGKGLAAGVASVRDSLQAIFSAAAKIAAGELPAQVSLRMSFNLLNPEVVRFLDGYMMDLIREVTSETRGAIQQIILRGWQQGSTAAQQARDIRSMIGLTTRQEAAIANYRRALESGPAANLRDALARSLRDGRYDRTLLRSLESGQGLSREQIDRLVQRYRERYLKYRADMIARTEGVRAANAGQQESWRQAREQGLLSDAVRRRWITSGDDRTCPQCDGLDGEVVGLEEDFPGGVDMPPAHPACRCSTGLVFPAREARAAA